MLWRRFPVERTYTVDDFGRTLPILIDSGCCRARPIKIGRFVCKPFNAAVGAGDGCSDWLLDFVCQRRGHFPQRAYTIDVRQVGFQLSPLLLLSNIHPCPKEILESPTLRDRNTHTTNVTSRSVRPHDSFCKVESKVVIQHLRDALSHELAIIRVYKSQIFFYCWGAVAVLEKLQVGNLIPLETRQKAKGRCDLLPGHVRFVGKRAEEGDAATLLNGVGGLEVECLPETLDCRKDLR